jgi:CRISPR-associated protein Cas2
MEELILFVFYDIPNDKIRNKVGEKCKDYGLTRIQYSGFSGKLDKNKRQELTTKLKKIIGDNKAILLIQPVCSKCNLESFYLKYKMEPQDEPDKPKIYFGMKLNRAYQNYEE